jgi:hypothetical protein
MSTTETTVYLALSWGDIQWHDVHIDSRKSIFTSLMFLLESLADGRMNRANLLTDYPRMTLTYKPYGNSFFCICVWLRSN